MLGGGGVRDTLGVYLYPITVYKILSPYTMALVSSQMGKGLAGRELIFSPAVLQFLSLREMWNEGEHGLFNVLLAVHTVPGTNLV